MGKLLVTGATGHLGRQTIEFLRQRVSADRIVAMARDPGALLEMAALGIKVRRGDYSDRASLVSAFAGVEKILLISAVAFSDRLTQHLNVVEAAKEAGVRHIVYTSIQRKPHSSLLISMITESDIATETALQKSGLDYTILFNSLYLEALPLILGNNVVADGVRVPGDSGKASMVSRRDLADANAVVLTQSGHENRSYTLGASEALSFAEIAAVLTTRAGKHVPYIETTVEAFVEAKVRLGIPQPAAAFLAEWVQAAAAGEFEEITKDLERLIGHRPANYNDFLTTSYAEAA